MRRPRVTRCGKTKKRRYRDKPLALLALRAAANSGVAWIPVRTYRCPFCHGWHLTSKP